MITIHQAKGMRPAVTLNAPEDIEELITRGGEIERAIGWNRDVTHLWFRLQDLFGGDTLHGIKDNWYASGCQGLTLL